MMTLRKSQDRGHFKIDWLDSYHTFSFGDYYDPEHLSYRDLRVINHDLIAKNGGFPTHPHRDMEIITYVLQGAVAHGDSMGNNEQLGAGEVQVMSAGTGVRHSEFNPSAEKALELLQIWVLPQKNGLTPSYAQKKFSREEKLNQLRLVVSPEGQNGSLQIHQDASLFASILEAGKSVTFQSQPSRGVWIQIAKGQLDVNGTKLNTGDGLAIEGKNLLTLQGLSEVEFLLFDLK